MYFYLRYIGIRRKTQKIIGYTVARTVGSESQFLSPESDGYGLRSDFIQFNVIARGVFDKPVSEFTRVIGRSDDGSQSVVSVITLATDIRGTHRVAVNVERYRHDNVRSRFGVFGTDDHISVHHRKIRRNPVSENVTVFFHFRVAAVNRNFGGSFPVQNFFFACHRSVVVIKSDGKLSLFENRYVFFAFGNPYVFTGSVRITVVPFAENVSRFGNGYNGSGGTAVGYVLFGLTLYPAAEAGGIIQNAIDFFDLEGYGLFKPSVA